MSLMFAVRNGFGFASLAAVISHTILYHGKEIMAHFNNSRSESDDIHAKLMDRYDEVPDWWYGLMFVANIVLAIVVCEVFGIDLPWWGVILAVALAAIFIIPAGIITALGHYMKIPPRHMFIAQSVGTIIAGLVNLSTAYLMFNLIPNILPFWLLSRRYPNSWFKYIHIPVFIGSTAAMPPAQPGMYTSWFLLAFVFQFVVYRYRNAWWSRFNYILSAGMDSGIALAVKLEWWGNEGDCPNF
ncbi:OPT oligopeptide transporter protein-domain-containing protein [Syncephalis fuscata]|nr:OPT oligopeptide transporter protein-domain-containing protein [Syncephalis fuscata]